MPTEWLFAAVTSGTALAVAAASYAAGQAQGKQTLRHDYDAMVRNKRIEAYTTAWALTQPLSLQQEQCLTVDQLHAIAQELLDWYFREGGLFLSRGTHDRAYFPLYKALVDAADAEVDDQACKLAYARSMASMFRTALADDIRGRSRSAVRR